MPALLSMRAIVKRYGDVLANDHVDLDVAAGEVHALLGENGAGKTTLMNVLYGLATPDGGEIRLDGRVIAPRSPSAAIEAGIGMVHQHPLLVGPLTVAENLCLGGIGDGTPGGVRAALADVERTLPLGVDPCRRVDELPLSLRQRIEIARCLAHRVRVLVLDEPTAVLTPEEVERLFGEMRALTAQGRSVVFITHKLGEVEAVADSVTVLRAGRAVASAPAGQLSRAELTRLMVGGPLEGLPSRAASPPGPAVLELDACAVNDEFGHQELRDCRLSVRAGEIVCLAGVEGNGQRPLAELLFGLRAPTHGEVRFEGRPIPPVERWRADRVAIARIAEDRRVDGLILDAPLWRNLLTGPMGHDAGRFVRRRALARWARQRLEEFGVVPADPHATAGSLSGGNQQKVVLARELAGSPRAVVAVNPTRGLDVGAQLEIYRRLEELRANGIAVLLISTDLDEVERLADRVGVLYRGALSGPFARGEVDRGEIGLLMAGVAEDGAGEAPIAARGGAR